ncbi:MAG: DUF721 domain-containing protein [Bacteroidetes bacterium]|nr:MAG: DUF721 domain-containing protein [Bacteroidota bacterium]
MHHVPTDGNTQHRENFHPSTMAYGNPPRQLGSVLKDVISSMGLDSRMARGRVLAAWEDIAGDRIGREVQKSWVRDRKLFLRIKSPVWRQELHLNRNSWCRRLNEELEADQIDEIVFR